MTSIRITIVLNGEIHKKLRVKQAKEIKNSEKSVSFSKIINECLKKTL